MLPKRDEMDETESTEQMKVTIKDLAVSMELGNTGIEFDIYDNVDKHLGDLRLGRGTIEWCRGRTRRGNGKKVSWEGLIAWLETQ